MLNGAGNVLIDDAVGSDERRDGIGAVVVLITELVIVGF